MNTKYVDIRKRLIKECASKNIPVVGEFEITKMCNLRCKMCYVVKGKFKEELTSSEWKEIFSAAVANGLLFALLTGGEILAREDFVELYEYLYDLGVKITLYTNGILINQEIIDVLKKRPPEYLTITLYGSSNETYAKITKDRLGFTKVDKAINLLIDNNIIFSLRTVAIPEIYQELDGIINYVKSKNMLLGYNLYVGPNDHSCCDNRLTPTELTDYEIRILKAFSNDSNLNSEFRFSYDGDSCAALKSAYFMTAFGKMQPCAMLDYPSVSLVNKHIINNFAAAWQEVSTLYRDIPGCEACSVCSVKNTCVTCKARRYLEGDFTKCSKYLREIAELRRKMIDEKI